MKKFVKILAATVAATAMVFVGAIFAGCNGDDGEDNKDAYNITVVGSDNTAINGQTGGANGGLVNIQICLPDGACIPLLPEITLGADGKVQLTQEQVDEYFEGLDGITGSVTEFEFHAMDVPGYVDDCSVHLNGPGDYTLVLTEAEPETPHECESVCPLCGKCTDADCTESACAEKCQGHVYNLTITLPDGNAASGAEVKVVASSADKIDAIYTAGADGKFTLDLVKTSSYAGVAQSYTLTVTSGEYSKTLTIQATSDNYDLAIVLE